MKRGVWAAMAVCCLRAAAQDAAPCAIAGTVLDSASDRPIGRARVMAEVPGSYSFVKLTDERGNFCFEKLTPANYHVAVQKAGYAEAWHPVTLSVEEDGVVKPIVLRMTRYASISGTVLGADGEPVPGAEVTEWERIRINGQWRPQEADHVSADGNGVFTISQVLPGTYYLSVKGAGLSGSRYMEAAVEQEVETFYSGSTSFAGATPVEVKAGEQLDGLVLTLRKGRLRSVTGRIPSPPRSGFLSYQAETETGWGSSGSIPMAKDGTFAKIGLPPAHYTIRLNDGKRWIAMREVDLTVGDATGVTLEPVETVDIPVTFRTEGQGAPFRPGTGGWDTLLLRESADEGVQLHADDDGSYRFVGVRRGIYRLRVELAGRRLYLKGVAYGGEAQTANRVDLRSTRAGSLELTFSSNVAEVQGRVSADEGADITVILVDAVKGPEAARIAGQAGTDQRGRFELATVPPGKYRLFAIEGFREAEWGSAGLAKTLTGKSVDLDLREGESRQVSVTAISAGEWQAAVRKNGG